ncbi:hypothetical protein ColKHC_12377 [Colletotrichum higginsianum]|nr:hypothetical protein ColKHC_12377 [Colletotrichum higginsianum]
MDHPKDFRSTVLQAPSRHDDRDRERERDRDRDNDRDRRHHRDIMNPTPAARDTPASACDRPHSGTSGLSHPNSYPSSSTTSTGPLAPTLPALGGGGGGGGGSGSGSSSGAGHHQAPPLSPLHPPSGYYPPPESHQTRDKPTTGSYYDPLTDTTRERRISDAGWSGNAAKGSPKANATRGLGHDLQFEVLVLPV